MPRGTLKVVMDFEVTGNAELKLKRVRMEAKKTGEDIEKMGNKADRAAKGGFKNLAGAYNALIVAGRIARAISAGLQPAIKMEEAMTKLAVTTGATKDEQLALAKAARAAAARTPFDPAQAIDAMTNVHLATGDVQSSVDTLLPTLQLANTFLGRDTKKASQVAGDFIRAFGLNSRDASLSLDMLTAAARFTRTRIDDMTGGFRKFGIVASVAGTNFADVLKVFTLAQATFRNAEANMTGLQRVVQRFSRPEIGGMIEQFLNVGIVDKFTGRMRPLSNIIVDMAKAAENNKDQWAKFVDIMSTTAEARAVKPLIAAVNTLQRMSKDGKTVTDVMGDFDAKLLGAEGTLTNMSEQAMKPLGQQLELLGDSLFKLLEAALGPLLYVITPIVQGLQAFMNTVSYLLNDIPVVSDVLSVVSGAFMTLAITAGIAKSAQFAFIAIQQITTMASTWAKTTMDSLGMSQIKVASTAGIAARANAVLAMSLRGLKLVAHSVKLAFKAMWRAITGPIGWIMLALEGVLWVIGKITGSGQDSAEKAAKKQQSMLLKQMSVAGSAFDKQGRGIGRLNQSIDFMKQAVDNWKNVIKSQLPTLPKTGLAFVTKQIGQVIKQYELQGRDATILKHQLEAVRLVFRKGGRSTLEEITEGQKGMMVLSSVLKGAIGPSKELDKKLKAVTEGIVNFKDNSGPMATIMMGLNIGTKEYRKELINQIITTENHLKSLGKVSAAEADALTMLAKSFLLKPESKEVDKMFADFHARMKDTNLMLKEQTDSWKKLDAELGMFVKFQKKPIIEFFKEVAKSSPSAKQRRLAQRFGGLQGPGGTIPGTNIPTAGSMMPAGAPGAAVPGAGAMAARSPNQNIATTATNTTKMVGLLDKIARGIKGIRKEPPKEPPPTPGRMKPPVNRVGKQLNPDLEVGKGV